MHAIINMLIDKGKPPPKRVGKGNDFIMLENSNLIESSRASEVNKLIKEYQDLTIKLADLDESKKQVLEQLFKLTEVGVNETGKYVFNIVLNKGRETIGVKNLKEKAPSIYSLIQEQELVSVGEPFKTIRGIKEKGKRA